MPDIYAGEIDLDVYPPQIDDEYPDPRSKNNRLDTKIGFSIFEGPLETGVNVNTICVRVNGVYAILDGVYQAGWDGLISPLLDGRNGYRVVIDPETHLSQYSAYLVAIDAEDLAGIPNIMPTYYIGGTP